MPLVAAAVYQTVPYVGMVKSHAAANMSFGNDKKGVIDAVTQILPIIGYPRSLNALAAINAVSK